MDFINDIIDWFVGLFKKNQPGKKDQKKNIGVPYYPKKPYTKSQVPDLETGIPEDLVKFILRWFVSGGMSLEGAAATVGNLWRESYLNPAQLQIIGENPKGPGRGLAQWTDPTLTKSKTDDVSDNRWLNYSQDFFPALKSSNSFWKNSVLTDLEPQLAYVLYEMKDGYPGVWKDMTTTGSVSSKTIRVLKKYEISRDRKKKEEQNYRVMLAEKMYNIGKKDPAITSLIQSRKKGK